MDGHNISQEKPPTLRGDLLLTHFPLAQSFDFQDGVFVPLPLSWDELRQLRDEELVRTDPWALKDRVMSQEKKDYRQALRDLPEHDSPEDAENNWPTPPE